MLSSAHLAISLPAPTFSSQTLRHSGVAGAFLPRKHETNLPQLLRRQKIKPCIAELGERADSFSTIDGPEKKEGGLSVGNSEEERGTAAATHSGQAGSVLSFLCPLLKTFGGGDPSAPRNALLETATSGVSTIARLPWGSKVLPEIVAAAGSREQPLKALQLYEFEACPFCRRVREALTELDLSVEIYPCPKGSIRHRQIVRESGGKDQFPFLVDPNTGVSLYESGDIVKYLFKSYGGGREPSAGLLESTLFTGWVPTIMRAGRGMTLWQHASPNIPKKKLELFSYENNQFARIVREALCELELPYILYNVGTGSTTLTRLQQVLVSSEVQIPFLVDPNTGVSLGNHQEILSYLFQNYSSTETAASSP